jgi:uncharacterized glyoxalase superfamily protein PhnB
MSQPATRNAIEIDSVYPRLTVRDAVAAIDWYQRVFGAQVLYRSDNPDGRVFHSLLAIGPARVIVTDEFPETNTIAPTTVGHPISGLHLYVGDVDMAAARAFEAGAEPSMRRAPDFLRNIEDLGMPPERVGFPRTGSFATSADPSVPHNTFWGVRYVMITDPFGWRWELATPLEQLRIGVVSDAIPLIQQIEERVKQGEQRFFLGARNELTAENARRRADEWHREHPNFNRPNVPPREPPNKSD